MEEFEHIRLCHSVASKFVKKSDHKYEDLIQELVITCLSLMRTFKPEKGVKFSTYSYMRLLRTAKTFVVKEGRYISVGDVSDDNKAVTPRLPMEEFIDFKDTVKSLDTVDRVIAEGRVANRTVEEVSEKVKKPKKYVSTRWNNVLKGKFRDE